MVRVVTVAGAAGSGVTRLVAAMRAVNPADDLDVREFDPGQTDVTRALLLIDPAAHADADDEQMLAALRAMTLRAMTPTIALVCTKTDAYWEWPQVLRAARDLLDPAAELPVFAVSAAAAEHGALDQSGIADLLGWLREESRCGPPADPPASRPPVSTPRASTPPGSSDPVALRRRIMADRDRGRADRLSAARVEFGAVRSAAVAEISARISDLGTASTGQGSATEHRRRLADTAAGAIDEVRARVADGLDEASARVLVGTPSAPPRSSVPGPDAAEVADIVDRAWRRSGISGTSRRRDAEDALLAVIGLSTGIGVGRLIGAGLGQLPGAPESWTQWAAVPVGVMIGMVVTVWVIRSRRRTTTANRVRTSTAEVLGELRGLLERQTMTRIGEVESAVAGVVHRHHDRQMRSAADQVAALEMERQQAHGPIGLR